MPTLRKDNGNKWMARAVIHDQQVACKMFSAGKKYGQAWRQAKTWEDEQKILVLSTFENEQRAIVVKAFQNEQKALAMKLCKVGHNALTKKAIKEELKSSELNNLHEKQVKLAFYQKTELQNVHNDTIIQNEQHSLEIIQAEDTEQDKRFQNIAKKGTSPLAQDKIANVKKIQILKRIKADKEDSAKTFAPTERNSPLKMNPFTRWGIKYLEHVERTMSHKTLVEKQSVMRNFYAFCECEKIKVLDSITPATAYEFISKIKDERGSNVANKYRKNLLAAWAWGIDFVDSFTQGISPFSKVKQFATQPQDRYVPPEEDIMKLLQQATGQDLILLLTLYFTGARRGEIFRLYWKDVDLVNSKVRLSDNKAGNGQSRVRWIQMHPELIKALLWWKENRPCEVDNVFMQTQCASQMGKPFTQRSSFMKNLCDRAKVKEFGFHAIRHKCASITFAQFGLNAAQNLMGHYRATTTDIYIKSAGLYSNQDEILTALGGNGIGKIAGDLLESNAIQKCYS